MKTNLLRHTVAACALALAVAGPAQANSIIEVEPNDTLAGAQLIVTNSPNFNIQGSRTFTDPSDDFFSFMVTRPGVLSIVSTSPNFFADSIMGLYDPSGNLVASNDDDDSGTFMSSISYVVGPGVTGLFAVAFSGFNPGLLSCTPTVLECYDTDGDFVFDTFVPGGGPGGSTGWDYRIVVTQQIPEPSTLLLAAVALGVLVGFDKKQISRKRRTGLA